jgi:hypothetical protein
MESNSIFNLTVNGSMGSLLLSICFAASFHNAKKSIYRLGQGG